jgi:hypothetical protein
MTTKGATFKEDHQEKKITIRKGMKGMKRTWKGA